MGNSNIKNVVLSTVVAGMLVGCGGGGGTSTSSSGNTGAGGGGHKGPFKEGQTVTATKLDSQGNADNTISAITTTTNSLGKFSFSSIPWSGPTEFKVEGEYLNENTGEYTAGGLLTAVTNVVEGTTPTVNINILTHIAAKSIKQQMANNVSITDATATAKNVVQETFNLKLDENTDLEDLDLTDGSEGTNQAANTQLLKISAALTATEDPEKTLENLATDLTDGEVDDEAEVVFQELKQKEEDVDLSEVAATMESVIELDNVPSSDDLLAGTISLDNSIDFNDILEASLGTSYESEEIIVEGIYGNSEAQISISSSTTAEFSINGEAFTNSGTIKNGDTLKLKLQSSPSYDTKVIATLDIGGTKFKYNVTTESDPFVADTKIKEFDFTSSTAQALNTQVESNTITIEGINTATDIFISDGSEYSINNGAYTSAAGTINNGDTLKVRHTTSSEYSTRTKTTVTFGLGDNQVETYFKSFTVAQDKEPTAFSFDTIYDTSLSSTVDTFSPVTVLSITGEVDVSVENGEYKIGEFGTWTDEDGKVSLNDVVYVRHTSSSSNSTKTTSSLRIGTKVAEFNSYSEALAEDTVPNEFTIDNSANTKVALSDEITTTINVAGINATTPISVQNGQYSINSGDFTSENGTVQNGDAVVVKHTSSSENLTKTVTTVNIGGITSNLVSYTKAADDTKPNSFSFSINEGVEPGRVIESEAVTIKGINTDTNVSVTDGEININNTGWTTSGTITNGQTLKVRHETSPSNDTKVESEITVGDFVTKFISLTIKPTPSELSIMGNDSVTNGQTSTITLSGTDVSSWIVLNNSLPSFASLNSVTGVITVKPSQKSHEGTTSNIEIAAVNNAGQTTVTPFTITVNNLAPVLSVPTGTSISKTKNSSLSVKVDVTDIENSDSTPYTFALVDAPSFLSINPSTGEITSSSLEYTESGNNTHNFKVTVNDGDLTGELDMALEVTEFETTQAAPTISGTVPTSIKQGELYSFTPIANDVNGDTLVFSISNNPSWLGINPDTGKVSGTPTNSDVGSHEGIVISVTDGQATSSLDSFNIEVVNVNDKPSVTIQENLTIAQGETLSLDLKSKFSDVDSDTLTYIASQEDGTPLPYGVTLSNGILTGTPGQEAVGEVLSIKVLAVDSNGAKSDPLLFTITVTNVNDAPELVETIKNKVVNEDEVFTYDITSNFKDIDKDALTYTAVLVKDSEETDLPSDIQFVDGVFSGNLGNDFVGTHMIKVTAKDSEKEVSDTFELVVQNTNDDPTALTIPKQTAYEDTPFTLDLKEYFEDVDVGDALTYTLVDSSGTMPEDISFENGVFSGTPDNDAVGTETFTVTATDKEGAKVSASFDIEVINVNDAPILVTAIDTLEVLEDTPKSFDFSATFKDIDVDDKLELDVTFADGVLLPSWMDFIDGVLTVNALNEHVGEHLMKLTATDLSGEKTIEEFTIVVTNVNDAPKAVDDTANTLVDTAVTIDVLANDSDEDKDTTLTIKDGSLTTPMNGSAQTVDGKIVYTPSSGYLGDDTFMYTVTDGIEESRATVNISVLDAPFNKENVIGKKLSNMYETYIFRENDIILADSGYDDFTEFLEYETIEDGKIKVVFRSGEYDIITKTTSGFTVEFFEFVNGTIQANGSESISTTLEDYNQTDIDTAFNDIQEQYFEAFDRTWVEKRYSSKYNISGNSAIKNLTSNTIHIEAFNADKGSESRAEARTYLDEPKTIIKADLEILEVNAYSQAQVTSVMHDVNTAGDTIYVTTGIKAGHMYYYVARYDVNGDNLEEEYANEMFVDVDSTVSDGTFFYSVKQEIDGNTIKFNVAKINKSTGTVIEEYTEKSVQISDTALDLEFDRTQVRAKSNIETTETQEIDVLDITKVDLLGFEARAGEPLSNAVQEAIAVIENTDIETDNIDTKIDEAEAILSSETSADATLAKTMIRVAELANDEDLASLLTFDVPSDLSTTNYLNQYIKSTVLDTINIDENLADSISAYNLSNFSTNMLHNVATELKQMSDDIGLLFPDSNPTAAYDHDGVSMNYEQSLAFRATLLAVAFKLDNLAAYRFGSDADYKTREHSDGYGGTFEYNDIAIDPAAVLNTGEFFKLVDGARIDTAKTYAIEALTLVSKLPIGFEDEMTQEDLDEAKKIKDALDGTASSYIMDVKNDDEIKSIEVDLSKLFSSAGALDISDFGSNWANTCGGNDTLISTDMAKIYNDLRCEYSDMYYYHSYTASQEPQTMPTAENSKIDDVVLKITKPDNSTLSGQALIDFLVDDDTSTGTTFTFNKSMIEDKTFNFVDSYGEASLTFKSSGDYEEMFDDTAGGDTKGSCSGSWSVDSTNPNKVNITATCSEEGVTGTSNSSFYILFEEEIKNGMKITVFDEETSQEKVETVTSVTNALSQVDTLTFAELTANTFLSVGDDWYDSMSYTDNGSTGVLVGTEYNQNDSGSYVTDNDTFTLNVTPSTSNAQVSSYTEAATGEAGTLTLVSTELITGYTDVYKTTANIEITTPANSIEWDSWDWTDPSYYDGTSQIAIIDLATLTAGFTYTNSSMTTYSEKYGDIMLTSDNKVVKGIDTASSSDPHPMYIRTTDEVGTWTSDSVNNQLVLTLDNEIVYLKVVNDAGTYMIEQANKLLTGFIFTEKFISSDTTTGLNTYISDNF
ncbi:putative Ig domain-containing protein [Arcobacter roscoffensis]|uniref:Ig domain-containing protein n=1 Tax=Arcobacter roscoffensis TaxID=2961520 RepID=A0ABY5E0N8_9BACT|nr:putative Ig domain-containing protein [Arcobacter roscoffensis]UTJ05774.1 putative Ig domain-containing protein [Arcobacter roscoffensis]